MLVFRALRARNGAGGFIGQLGEARSGAGGFMWGMLVRRNGLERLDFE